MTENSISYKTCTRCKQTKPATQEYFHKMKNGLYGLRATCKVCQKEVHQEYRNNPEVKEQMRLNARKWNKDNRELIKERYHENPERGRDYTRKYRANNPDRKDKYDPVQSAAKYHRYRAKKEALPNTLTTEQWQRAIGYFDGCCAICGRQALLALDHWIPVSYEGSDNPGTVATNAVPLCHGKDGCNQSKNRIMPNLWLIQKYGEQKGNEILEKINSYFEWVKTQDSEP